MKRKIEMPYNIMDLKNLYESTDSGYWFSPDTMRFFKSRLTDNFKRLDEKTAVFISTEKFNADSPRLATVRIATIENGKVSINTHGEFYKMTLGKAKRRLEEITLDSLNQENAS